MPKMTTESFGIGNHAWVGSSHGLWNGRTITLDVSAFTPADHFPDGFIRSGQPVAEVGDLGVPYNAAGVDGSEVLLGFVLNDQAVTAQVVADDEDLPVAVLDHGRIRHNRLPVLFTVPADAGAFTFQKG